MNSFRRNVLTGFTVLLALIVLGFMIVRFGGKLADPFSGEKLLVEFEATNVAGLSEGSAVTYSGIEVGKVESLKRTGMTTIQVVAALQAEPPLPGNLNAVIRQTNFLGTGAVVALEMEGADPVGQLEGGVKIPTRYAGNDIIPSEVSELAAEMNVAVSNFNDAGIVDNFNQRIRQIGEIMDDVKRLTGSDAVQQDLEVVVANLRTASEDIQSTTAGLRGFGDALPAYQTRVDNILENADGLVLDARAELASAGDSFTRTNELAQERLLQLEAPLDNVASITAKIDRGEGTIGKFVNDDAFYAAALDVIVITDDTLVSAKRLIEQFEQDGFKVGF